MSFYYCFYRVLFEIYLKAEGISYVVLLSFLKGVILEDWMGLKDRLLINFFDIFSIGYFCVIFKLMVKLKC